MLPKQVLAIIIAIGRADHYLNMLPRGLPRFGETRQIGGPLVIELDQKHRAVNPIIETLSASVPPIQANQVLST